MHRLVPRPEAPSGRVRGRLAEASMLKDRIIVHSATKKLGAYTLGHSRLSHQSTFLVIATGNLLAKRPSFVKLVPHRQAMAEGRNSAGQVRGTIWPNLPRVLPRLA